VRPYDAVCRYGGEEFLLILPGCSLADAVARAEQIRNAVSGAGFEVPEGPLQLTCSLGAASVVGASDFDAVRLIREADEALYAAKDRGRNRVEVFAGDNLTLAK
jgi:diguanylate cyclase (GGDEF)-like protein